MFSFPCSYLCLLTLSSLLHFLIFSFFPHFLYRTLPFSDSPYTMIRSSIVLPLPLLNLLFNPLSLPQLTLQRPISPSPSPQLTQLTYSFSNSHSKVPLSRSPSLPLTLQPPLSPSPLPSLVFSPIFLPLPPPTYSSAPALALSLIPTIFCSPLVLPLPLSHHAHQPPTSPSSTP